MIRKVFRVTTRYLGGNLLSVICILITLRLVVALLMSYSGSTQYFSSLKDLNLDIRQLENAKIDKLIIEQEDGSINLVFHIPSDLQINQALKHASLRTLPPLRLSNLSGNNVSVRSNKTDSKKGAVKNGIKTTSKPVKLKSTVKPTVRSNLTTSFPLTVAENPYQINNKHICSGVKDLLFLILVHTSTLNFQRRNNIRETWANANLFRNHSMRIVFLLGKPQRQSTQALIEHENVLHRDIVQGKFIDSYHNLTHKGVLGLRWITDNCRQAKVIVKVDDDVFLNIFKLMDNMLTEYKNIARKMMCAIRNKGTSKIQRRSGKWKVDDAEFFNQTHYPVTYCNGFFVVITSDIIPELYEAAKTTPFFWVDDVYVYGLLPNKVGNITHIGLQHLNVNEKEAIKCFESNKPCSMLVANAHSDGVMDKLWFGALTQHKQLAERYVKKTLFNNS